MPGRILHARYSRYMQRVREVAPELVEQLEQYGARFTHHSSIAPTGTISLSLANNASNGIEPSFAHHYFRNVIREGKKSKEKIDVFSFELLAYRELVNPRAMPGSTKPGEKLPDYFMTAEDITPREHVDIQAASQKWIDSSISKTANVPTDYPYEDFKDIYLYAHEKGLKGCTTFRFNPEAFQGVLVKEKDLKNTTYRFTLEDGTEVEAKGDEEIEYDGEMHTAANLFDALKEGYYGKFLRAREPMARIKIDKKIVKYRVAKDEEPAEAGSRRPSRERRVQRHPDAREARASGDADRLDLQDQDAGVRSRDVRDDQRHRAERRHAARAAAAVRDLHQLEEPRSLPVDRRADAHHLGRVPQGRRRDVPGRRAEGRVRSARRLLAAGRQVHAVDHRRARPRRRKAPA